MELQWGKRIFRKLQELRQDGLNPKEIRFLWRREDTTRAPKSSLKVPVDVALIEVWLFSSEPQFWRRSELGEAR